VQLIVRRDDVQVGPYAYRVLRPATPLRRTLLTPASPASPASTSSDGTRGLHLHITRRDGARLLRLASLVASRTLAAFPLRDAQGRPHDLVLVDEALQFPPDRWSDVRQRLGAGRLDRLTPHPDAAAPPQDRRRSPTDPQVVVSRTATLLYATPDTFRDRTKLLMDGAQTIDLARRCQLHIHFT
jgi:hypothetical protein